MNRQTFRQAYHQAYHDARIGQLTADTLESVAAVIALQDSRKGYITLRGLSQGFLSREEAAKTIKDTYFLTKG